MWWWWWKENNRNVVVVVVDVERIVWCYSQWQAAYTQMLVAMPHIEFVNGILRLWSRIPILM